MDFEERAFQFRKGDRVRIREGSFENFEGKVDSIDILRGTVTTRVTLYGRSTPIDVQNWQLELIERIQ